jgi:hypothetical protein
MTTIVTPLGCSRSELSSLRELADTRENPAVMLQKKNSAAPLLARRSPQRGEIIDLVYFPANRSRRSRRSVGIAEAVVHWHGGRYGRPYRAGRSVAEPIMEGD